LRLKIDAKGASKVPVARPRRQRRIPRVGCAVCGRACLSVAENFGDSL